MTKYYSTDLYKLNRGYVKKGVNGYIHKWNCSIYSEKIIVEKTLNPFYVKELLTGVKIPSAKMLEKMPNVTETDKTLISIENFNVFVPQTEYMNEVKSFDEIEKYYEKHKDIEKFRNELLEFVSNGKSKIDEMLDKKQETKNEKKLLKKRIKQFKRQI